MSSIEIILIFVTSWFSAGVVIAALWQTFAWPSMKKTFIAILSIASFVVVLLWRPDSLLISNAAVLLFAIGVAFFVGKSLGSFGALVTFAATVSVVDTISFAGGLTRKIIDEYERGTSNLLQFLVVSIPTGDGVQPLVGVGDLCITGALFLGLARLHGHMLRASVVLVLGLTVAIAIGLFAGGVAGLPFLAVAAVIDGWYFTRKARNRLESQSRE